MGQQLFYSETMAGMTARRLALSLLNVSGKAQETIAHLVAAGQLFGIEPSSMRMAVGRLMKEGLLVNAARGRYELGTKGQAMRDRLRGWRDALDRTKPWDGDWLAVHTGHLGRTDRKQLRSRTRALKLSGFAEAVPGFWLRPANLVGSLREQRHRLVALGLDEDALVARIAEFDSDLGFDPSALWPTDILEPRYKEAIAAMAESTQRIPHLPAAESARETLLVGQTVLHTINLDPLLPQEIIDQTLLKRMIEDMRAYNALGLDCWQQFYADVDAPQPA